MRDDELIGDAIKRLEPRDHDWLYLDTNGFFTEDPSSGWLVYGCECPGEHPVAEMEGINPPPTCVSCHNPMRRSYMDGAGNFSLDER